jgi:plasmid maintenance system antidote protein VapI
MTTNEEKVIIGMSGDEIRAAFLLAKPKIKVPEIARAIGACPQQVHQVINGDRPTARIREEIARRLGKTVAEIWPKSKVEVAA